MIFSILYVWVFSFGMVLIQSLDANIPPTFSLLITALIATLYFNAVNVHKLKIIYQACWQEKWQWFGIMVTVLVLWVCTMVSPGWIGASLFILLDLGLLGAIGFIMLGIKGPQKNQRKLYCGLSLLLLMGLTIAFNLLQHPSSKGFFGIVLALIAGLTSFAYFKQSQALIRHIHLSATQILAVRFYFTIILLFILQPKHSFALYLTWHNCANLTLLAILSLIIPLYLSQKALEKISSELHAIIISFSPILIGILQQLFFHDLHWEYALIYLCYTAIMISAYFKFI